jgi:beta-carotene hydroxylase
MFYAHCVILQMLRYKEDWRCVAVMVGATATCVGQWIWGVHAPLVVLAVALALPVAVLAHNHHHAPMWKSRTLNTLTGYWLTFFYGGPAIAWLAIHNRSHHAHQNRRDLDVTSTHNVGDRNDLVGAIAYVPRCLNGMTRQAGRALATIYRRSPAQLWFHVSHIVLLYGTIALLIWIDWRKALWTVILPQQIAINAIANFNFFQHADTDASSKLDTSRNFTGRAFNVYLFNAGFHTVHHLQPKLHWSLAAVEHARVAGRIDPRLNEPSFWRYFARVVGGTARRSPTTAVAQPR